MSRWKVFALQTPVCEIDGPFETRTWSKGRLLDRHLDYRSSLISGSGRLFGVGLRRLINVEPAMDMPIPFAMKTDAKA